MGHDLEKTVQANLKRMTEAEMKKAFGNKKQPSEKPTYKKPSEGAADRFVSAVKSQS